MRASRLFHIAGLLVLGACAAEEESAPLPAGVTEGHVTVDGVELRYLRGGRGTPVVLLNGWPQSAYQWRKIMPRLMATHTVVAIDLPGTGESATARDGYDKRSIARRIHGLVESLELDNVAIVGHDIGGMVAFQYAAQFPDEVSTLVIAEAPIPSEVFFQLPAYAPDGSGIWWFGLHNVAELPEALIEGRERIYYGHFFRSLAANPDAIEREAVDEYVRTNAGRERVAAGLGYYRSFEQDIGDNAGVTLATRVVAIGGEHGIGGAVAALLEPFAQNVTPIVIPGAGHWIPEEQPDAFVDALLPFLPQ